jgi:ABC-type sugar transport system permease subunit
LSSSQAINPRKVVAAYWYLLLVPIFVVLSVIEFYPLLYGIYLSLTGPNGGLTLANYSQMIADRNFWNSVGVSITYSTLSTGMAISIGLGLTFLVTQEVRGRRLYEAIFVLPMAAAPLMVGIVWGPSAVWDDFQTFTHFILGLPYFQEVQILFYFPVMSFSEAWEWAPLVMLVSLSIMRSIPKEVYEAARLHGGSGWQLFRKITVPAVLGSPVLQFVVVLRFIDAMRAFEIPLAWSTWVGFETSVGSPVDSLSLYLYKLLFIPSFGFPLPMVSAIAVALLVVTLVSATVMMRLLGSIGR